MHEVWIGKNMMTRVDVEIIILRCEHKQVFTLIQNGEILGLMKFKGVFIKGFISFS